MSAEYKLSLLQISFAARGTEFTAPPWMVLDAVRSSGVNLFAECAEVNLKPVSVKLCMVNLFGVLLMLECLANALLPNLLSQYCTSNWIF